MQNVILLLHEDHFIHCHRWRLFRKPIRSKTEKVVLFVQAAVSLHNYLRTMETSMYSPTGLVDTEDDFGNEYPGSWRSDNINTGFQDVTQTSSNRYSIPASNVCGIIHK